MNHLESDVAYAVQLYYITYKKEMTWRRYIMYKYLFWKYFLYFITLFINILYLNSFLFMYLIELKTVILKNDILYIILKTFWILLLLLFY